MTDEQESIIKHAQGNGKVGFCTSLDCLDMLGLVAQGLFQNPIGMGMVGENSGIFHLTREGRNYVSQEEDEDPTPCCYQHGVGAIGTNEPCPKIADND